MDERTGNLREVLECGDERSEVTAFLIERSRVSRPGSWTWDAKLGTRDEKKAALSCSSPNVVSGLARALYDRLCRESLIQIVKNRPVRARPFWWSRKIRFLAMIELDQH